MKLDISEIKDKNIQDKERIVLVATEDCDSGRYILFSTKWVSQINRVFSNAIFNPFWFPDTKIKKGDLIVVYTRAGEKSSKANNDGTTSYFYYRGLSKPLFVNDDDAALLIEAATWKVK